MILPPPKKAISDLAGLGRVPQHDDRNHPMPRKIATVTRRMWNAGPILDQGSTPQCVGYAGWGWLAGGPVVNKPKFTPTDLYHQAQDNDEWPGSDYDGSSTLGLMKALKKLGFIDKYVWAKDADTLMAWVLSTGPVLLGTNWYMDMFTPDSEDFLEPVGDLAGGHEWRAVGGDTKKVWRHTGDKGAFRMANSWGPKWSDNGRAWVSMAVVDRLLREGGDAVTALEKRP